MNNEEKKEQIDDIQKDIVSTCFKQCFDLKLLEINEKCTQTCYSHYINTLKDVSQEIRRLGYKYNSIMAYKSFPEEDIWARPIYSSQFMQNKQKMDFAQDYVTNRTA